MINSINLFVVVFILFSYQVYGQSINASNEINFSFEVKQIDEFIDRFNNNQNTLASKLYLENFSEKLNYGDNIFGLFDLEKKWDDHLMNNFIECISSDSSKNKLDFYDDNWFAKVTCSVFYKHREEKVDLILKIVGDEKKGAKWSIVSVLEDFVPLDTSYIKDKHSNKIINPMSHGTDFMALRRQLNNDNLDNYFSRNTHNNKVISFKNCLLKKTITFLQVDSITYYFLQIPNYVFTLDFLRRESKNAGWLISSLRNVLENEKQFILDKELNVSK